MVNKVVDAMMDSEAFDNLMKLIPEDITKDEFAALLESSESGNESNTVAYEAGQFMAKNLRKLDPTQELELNFLQGFQNAFE